MSPTRWHDDDAWWRTVQGYIFGLDAWERAPRDVDEILKLTGQTPPLQVLDLPCGVGRHTLELARRGCAVTGVDRTLAFLDEARTHARDLALHVELVEGDMREFVRPQAFDLALNLFSSFGYFEDEADDRRVLANLHSSLRPGGLLVMELMSREVLARIFRPRDWQELPDGTLVLEERRITHDWTWIENRWIFIHGSERHDLPLSHRLYAGADLCRALEATGFVDVKLFGSYAGTPYDNEAQRLVVVAHRGR